MSSITVDGLTRRFGDLIAVDHLSFDVKEGEIFGMLGPNGAGKTTTIRMLACLISPSEGSAIIEGHDIVSDSIKIRQIVGILTETQSLYERLTVYENMAFFSEAYGVSNTDHRRERIGELLEFFDLWERRGHPVGTLSRGMKQKLAMARALVHNPSVLFLDEPTVGLDPEASRMIRDLIQKLSQHQKCTVLLCTHRLEDAERLCSRVMIVNRGRNMITGTPQELGERIAGRRTLEITLRELSESVIEAVRASRHVEAVDVNNLESKLLVTADDLDSITPEIVKDLVSAGGLITGVNITRPSLEDAYLSLIREGPT